MRHAISAMLLIGILPTVAPAAGPVCALLDPEKHPRAALLEAKLLSDNSATWVERADIDKVFQEQKLQALFSPQGVGERVQLGKLLKADVLVMVRPVKGAETPTLEVVVSETASGLRLLHRAVPITKNSDEDVTALLAAAKDGIKRHGETITEIVAVPPFVSNDLEFTHDYLKGALAKLAEAEALGRKGVVVVELAEAEALAKELALTAPGGKLNRPLPVYLLGEYRNEGKGKNRTISLKLRAERGGKVVGKPVELQKAGGEETEAVRKWSAELLDTLAKDDKPRPPSDTKAEAKQLADRARAFARLANWEEATALIEASLLLDPTQTDLHAQAVKVLTPIVSATFLRAVKDIPGEAAATRRIYNRGLEHLEAFLVRGGDLSKYHAPGAQDLAAAFHHSVHWLINGKDWDKVAKVEMQGIKDDERAVYLRIIPHAAKSGPHFPEWQFVAWVVGELPAKEKYAQLEKIILDLQMLPTTRARTIALVRGHVRDVPEYVAFLDRLAASKNKDIRDAAVELKKNLDLARKTPAPKHVTDPKGLGPNPPGPDAVKLTPIDLKFEGRDPTNRSPRGVVGLLAVGKNLDVVWTGDGIYLMKDKGKLRLLWRSPGLNDWAFGRFSSVCFDGKYVWGCFTLQKKNPTLLVIDPQTEKVWDVSSTEGLPQAPLQELVNKFSTAVLVATPVSEGKVCASGMFLGRAWVGLATFDPVSGKVKFKVFHEARDAHNQTDKEQWSRTTTAFAPFCMFTLRSAAGAGAKSGQRVIIGRGGGENYKVREHLLLVDPERETVDVLKDRIWSGPTHDRAVMIDGAIYFMEPYPNPDSPNHPLTHVARLMFPGPAKEIVLAPLPPSVGQMSRLAFHGGKVHIVLEQHETDFSKGGGPVRTCQWWTMNPDGKNSRRVATGLPPIGGMWESSHYGFVALVDQARAKPPLLHTVELVEPNQK